MSSITTMVGVITTVLIGFVAIAHRIIDYDCDYHVHLGSRTYKKIGIPTCNGGFEERHQNTSSPPAIEGFSPVCSYRLRHFNQCRRCENDKRGELAQLPWEAALIEWYPHRPHHVSWSQPFTHRREDEIESLRSELTTKLQKGG